MSYNKLLKKDLPSILIFLIPLFLITGPFLSDLSLSLVTIIFIFIVIKDKKFEYFNNSFFKIFSIFYLYLVFNSFTQNQNLDSYRIALSYFRFGIFSIALFYFLNLDKNLLKKIFFSLLFCYLILIFDGLFQFIFKENIIGYEIAKTDSGLPLPRVSSFFGDEMILGSYMTRFFPILFGLYLYFDKLNKYFYLFLPIIIFTIILVFLSGERTALFLLIFSLFLMTVLFTSNKKKALIVFICLLITSFSVLTTSDSVKDRVVDVTISQIIKSKGEKKNFHLLTRQHEEHYVSAWRMFKDNKLTGLGIKNFRNFCSDKKYFISDYTCSPHPHNTYIQLLSETGIIGFMIVFSFFLYFSIKLFIHFIKIFKKKKLYSDIEICLIISIFLTLWPLTPSGNFFNNWLSIVYFFPVGILIWINSKNHMKLESN